MTKTTTKKKAAKAAKATEVAKDTRAQDRIKEQVLDLLGTPDDLYRFSVHFYANKRARVNVWRREMIKPETRGGFVGAMGRPELVETTHITDSFYLSLGHSATIKTANPPITRKY